MNNSVSTPPVYINLVLFALLLTGCFDNKSNNTHFSNITPVDSEQIEFDTIQLDSLKLNKIPSSYSGFITIHQDSLLFVDDRYARIFSFDEQGNLINQHLGIGPGPREIPNGHIVFYDTRSNGNHIFIGGSNDYHEVNSDYERVQSNVIRWKSDKPISYLQNNPIPEDQRSYNLAYDIGHIRTVSDFIFLPLASPPPPLSVFNLNTDVFAEEARILAKMNIETGDVEDLLGRFSPVFSENENARIFSFFSFDIIGDDQIAITYRPDPLIYLADLDFNILSAFGVAGREMDLNYEGFPSTPNTNTLTQHWINETESRGYYTSLRYIKEHELLFRSYQKGGESQTDGLQIYRDKILIADVDVPKKFTVAGYISPHIYSAAYIEEMEESITIYKFNIDELL